MGSLQQRWRSARLELAAPPLRGELRPMEFQLNRQDVMGLDPIGMGLRLERDGAILALVQVHLANVGLAMTSLGPWLQVLPVQGIP